MHSPDGTHVIALDIGSTRTHVGLIDLDSLTCLFRADFLSSDIPHYLQAALDKACDKAQADSRRQGFAPVVIGGGRTANAPLAEKIAAAAGAESIAHVRCHPRLPLAFCYEKPEALGADRIADALYARAAYEGQCAILIDSGTAITVDALSSERGFLGGVIMAGIDAQLQSLHAQTHVLPLLAIPENAIPFPGTSTESCMLAGAAQGTAGALNHLVREYQKLLGGQAVVLATGGAWRMTEKIVDFAFTTVPDMTLIGTALYKE